MRLTEKIAILYLLFFLSSTGIYCGQFPQSRNDWEIYKGPGVKYFNQQETEFPLVEDKLEPINRGLWAVNDYFIDWLFAPISWGYRRIIPEIGRLGIRNVFDNARYPVRFVGNVSQGKFHGSWQETKRFFVDTTIGIVGLLDKSGEYNMAISNEDIGQTFGEWGWRNSNYVFLPILGPSSVRDTVGYIFDSAFDPASFVPGASIVRGINNGSDEVRTYQHLAATNYDIYHLARNLSYLNRDFEIVDHEHPETGCQQCSSIQTLGAVFFTYQDAKFPSKSTVKKVKLAKINKELPYSFWLQPKPAPLMFILPGLGGHRLEKTSIALAEMVYKKGFSAVVISNAMNFEFIKHGLSKKLPGFIPSDAYDVHIAIDSIYKDLIEEFPNQFTKKALMGISMGAFHTLYIAAHKENLKEDLISFDRYIAINPPVRIEYGVHQIDDYYNVYSELPKEKQRAEVEHLIQKAFQLSSGENLKPTGELLLSDDEAKSLIGLAFRGTLQSIIFQTQNKDNMGVLKSEWSKWDRWAVQQEISEFSFVEYFYAFVLPYFANLRDDITNDEKGAQRMFELCNVQSLGAILKKDPGVLIVTNENDFLLSQNDFHWLKSNFNERCHLFMEGGHLGNLYIPSVQNEIMKLVMDLTEAR